MVLCGVVQASICTLKPHRCSSWTPSVATSWIERRKWYWVLFVSWSSWQVDWLVYSSSAKRGPEYSIQRSHWCLRQVMASTGKPEDTGRVAEAHVSEQSDARGQRDLVLTTGRISLCSVFHLRLLCTVSTTSDGEQQQWLTQWQCLQLIRSKCRFVSDISRQINVAWLPQKNLVS